MNLMIGLDGGGTKTELVLIDETGTTLATHIAPGCNPSQIGPDQARAVLDAALSALRSRHPAGTVQRTLMCVAGNRDFWRETAAALLGFGTVSTVDDSRPVLELATDGKPGLVLHAGTGSFIAARTPDGAVHYAGGLGWRFGDPGSGSDLGRRGIAAGLLELQARGDQRPLSPLAAALCVHTGIPDYVSNSRYFYNDPGANATIAGFTPRVIELAATGCAPAQQVIADSVADLARQADDVIRRLFPHPAAKLPCGVSGKILNSPAAATALRSQADRLKWPVALRPIEAAPIEGVKRMLLANR